MFRRKPLNRITLDSKIKPLESFLIYLQIHCIPECCGISAFSFDSNDIEGALIDTDCNGIEEKIERLLTNAYSLKEEKIDSDYFNHIFQKQEFIVLFEQILNDIKRIKIQSDEN